MSRSGWRHIHIDGCDCFECLAIYCTTSTNTLLIPLALRQPDLVHPLRVPKRLVHSGECRDVLGCPWTTRDRLHIRGVGLVLFPALGAQRARHVDVAHDDELDIFSKGQAFEDGEALTPADCRVSRTLRRLGTEVKPGPG